ncbi:hypothetical protein PoB_006577000 [Plakobranchus ocellatus]|uniref:Uncharacterized protein n=1 Tax=Plakobranchus ocellatus TaxID=259542 RepID=A0AAV4D540_9GAST|nr:hypothetical protein PoB_006577000 [Plakobranchus ocellatus]
MFVQFHMGHARAVVITGWYQELTQGRAGGALSPAPACTSCHDTGAPDLVRAEHAPPPCNTPPCQQYQVTGAGAYHYPRHCYPRLSATSYDEDFVADSPSGQLEGGDEGCDQFLICVGHL